MRLFHRWIDRPWIDWIGLLVACAVIWEFAAKDILPAADRGSLYQSLAGIAIGMLGLGSVTATLIVTVTPNNRLRTVLDQVGGNLLKLIFGCLFNFLLVTGVYTALYFFPANTSEEYRNVLFVGGTIIMVLSSCRLIWLLRRVLLLLA